MTETPCTNCVGGLVKDTGAVCNVCEGKGNLQWFEQDEVFPQTKPKVKAVRGKIKKVVKPLLKAKKKKNGR